MTTSEILSGTQLKRLVPNWLLLGLLIFSFIGFTDASYLTIWHYQGNPITCAIFKGCEAVTNSAYSQIGGIPLSLFGMIFYLGIFLFTIIFWDTRNKKIGYLICMGSIVGIISSAYFLYLQAFILNQFCDYCMLSAFTSAMIFIFGIVLFRHLRKEHLVPPLN